MSIILVLFPGAPKPTAEAIQADKDLEANIQRRMKGCLNILTCNDIQSMG